jgi:hypothetical protein
MHTKHAAYCLLLTFSMRSLPALPRNQNQKSKAPFVQKRSNQMFRHPLVLMIIGLITAIASQAAGQVPSGTKVGTLNCQLAPSVGFIIGSHDPMRCRYTPDGPFPPEFYDGVITTVGLNIGFTTGGEMAWAVIAPILGPPRGGLAGEYLGVSGSVTPGVGAGANVLIGGSQRSFVLQPLSVQGQTGLDLTLGVSGLELRWVPPTTAR